jgi:outer membrane immunogenic protein
MMAVIDKKNLRYVFASLLLFFSMPDSVLASTLAWQGPYAGVFLGGVFGNNRASTNSGSATDTSYFTTSADINALNNAGTWTKKSSTIIAGLRAGHDWDWKQIVYGIVFDYSALPLSSSKTINNTYPSNSNQYSIYTSMRTNWLFTLRGRLGYQNTLYVPSLFYFTGGMAMTELRVSNNFNDTSALAGRGGNDTSQNQTGWATGAGIEIAALKHVSVDFEYLYISIPSVKTIASISNTQGGFGIPVQSMTSRLSTSANFYANIFKIGVNYRFDE